MLILSGETPETLFGVDGFTAGRRLPRGQRVLNRERIRRRAARNDDSFGRLWRRKLYRRGYHCEAGASGDTSPRLVAVEEDVTARSGATWQSPPEEMLIRCAGSLPGALRIGQLPVRREIATRPNGLRTDKGVVRRAPRNDGSFGERSAHVPGEV